MPKQKQSATPAKRVPRSKPPHRRASRIMTPDERRATVETVCMVVGRGDVDALLAQFANRPSNKLARSVRRALQASRPVPTLDTLEPT